MISQMYRQKRKLSAAHGNDKSVIFAALFFPEKLPNQRQRWDEALQMYGDYFIGYSDQGISNV
jgi:hypothetical protein